MPATMNTLYFAPGACSFVPHVALERIKATTGEDFEPKLVKLHKGENKAPEYLAMNPNGQVPVLVVDGKPLVQIVAICDHLDRTYPKAGLLPTDPWARTQALSDLAWMNNTVHPTFTHIFRPYEFADDETAQANVKKTAVARFRQLLERIQEKVKSAAPFRFGGEPTFHDAYAFTFLRWGGIAGIDPKSLPAYHEYIQRVMAHPSVAAAIARERIALDTFKG
jgi:glutathione S-transferase